MFLGILFLVVPSLSLPYSQREANYRLLPVDVGDPAGKIKLIFANAVWRHGDRSPERQLPGDGTDKFSEDDWKFGGGGYGELSPEGMAQQYMVGTKIAKRYMQQFQFLTKQYRANEIYIQSTDYNRTLISAYSNLAGMYAGTAVPDSDFPSGVQGWPKGWVPVPVHTVVNKYDYVGNPDAECKRKSQVKQMIINSDDFVAYKNDPTVKATLDWLSSHSKSSVTVENSYWFQDTMTCEQFHQTELGGANADATTWYPWYFDGKVADITNTIVGKALDFQDGLANPLGVKGIDVSVEMPKMRAGETIGTIYGMIQGVLHCYKDPSSDECRKFYKNRKYFAISAHDKTVAALLTLLGPKKYVIPMGYPDYAAAMLIELYVEEGTDYEYFKVLYLANPNVDDFVSVTNFVTGCPLTDEYCPLSVLTALVDKYTPKPDMDTYCNTDVFANQ
ncbi:hypothetical protein PMAYCL1PPCAC_09161 [Pristionchus mayeri]|uniref:acid phosphatase n=1 Tax=Pristionchus mayeri TaxID=1317129 RepID=A0AAN4ZH39_9BILA|nr:hypothetical protein PMAYCL1PPCAC_09161 [Pristionchus mayeri]